MSYTFINYMKNNIKFCINIRKMNYTTKNYELIHKFLKLKYFSYKIVTYIVKILVNLIHFPVLYIKLKILSCIIDNFFYII